MPAKIPQGMDAAISRRRFLRRSAGVLCALPLATAWAPAARASAEDRRLSFLHTHTGERLSVCYFGNGDYLADGMASVRHLCRDFRSGDAHDIDPALLDILHELQALTGPGTFEIISAYRSPATNAQLRKRSKGVAEKSLHLTGQAMDVRLPRFSTRRLAELARSLQRGGVGYYASSDFVHVDTGRVRYW